MGLFKKARQIAYMQAQNDLRIINDSFRILETTKNEDTFYSRLELAERTINHLCSLHVKTKGASPSQLKKSFERDKPEIIKNFNARSYNNRESDKYYKGMDRIEAMWSVLQNLRIFTGEQADKFELECKKNINSFHRMIDYDMKKGMQTPKHAPCYMRLAMLYEKQERYEEAINICVMAIQAGAWDDHSSGKMYGRLARLIRKSGLQVSPDIMLLAERK